MPVLRCFPRPRTFTHGQHRPCLTPVKSPERATRPKLVESCIDAMVLSLQYEAPAGDLGGSLTNTGRTDYL